MRLVTSDSPSPLITAGAMSRFTLEALFPSMDGGEPGADIAEKMGRVMLVLLPRCGRQLSNPASTHFQFCLYGLGLQNRARR
jgi:hypothetical protein